MKIKTIPLDLAWLAINVKKWPARAEDKDSVRRTSEDWAFTSKCYSNVPNWTFEELYQAKIDLGLPRLVTNE